MTVVSGRDGVCPCVCVRVGYNSVVARVMTTVFARARSLSLSLSLSQKNRRKQCVVIRRLGNKQLTRDSVPTNLTLACVFSLPVRVAAQIESAVYIASK